MAELVGCFAASHGPLLVRDWARVPEAEKTRLTAAFRELGRRMDAARPDVLIEVSPDHSRRPSTVRLRLRRISARLFVTISARDSPRCSVVGISALSST